MATVVRTPLAEQDLREILRHIVAHNYQAATGWLEAIEEIFCLIATQPEMGEQRKSITGETIRRHTFGNYVIYYRPSESGIEVVRVLHGARDHSRLL